MVVRFSKIAFTITILLVNLFFTTRIFGQGNETYYAVIDTTLTQVSIPPYTASQIVVWSNSAAKSIPLYFWNWNTDSLPSSLPPNKAENQVNESAAVCDVAMKVGIPQRNVFHRTFKNYVGVAPSKFQRILLSGEIDTRK
jgi:hypothetical protein